MAELSRPRTGASAAAAEPAAGHRAIAPKITLGRIYRGAMPFVLVDLAKVARLILFPAIALWLPPPM